MTRVEEAKRKFEQAVEERGFQRVGEYVKNNQKVELVCEKGHRFSITPNHFMQGHGCAKCSDQCPEQARESFYDEIEKRGYQRVGEYVKSSQKVELVCEKGHPFSMAPNSFMKGQGCAKCGGNCPDQARELFYDEIEKRGFQKVGEYVNNKRKIALVCEKGHPFLITPTNFMQGQGCAKCAKEQTISRGEEAARACLARLGVSFLHDQPTFFPEKRRLRPDFVLPDFRAIIEIDGGDHFEKTSTRGNYKKTHPNDLYKDQWCQDHGWHMIRIRYLSASEVKRIPDTIEKAIETIRADPTTRLSPDPTYYSQS